MSMKITLEATGTIDTVQGKIPARIWTGHTESGVPIKAWIAVVQPQTDDAEKLAEFDREMTDMPVTRQLVSFDLRLAI